jgi:hypothetical protein
VVVVVVVESFFKGASIDQRSKKSTPTLLVPVEEDEA